MIIPWGTGLLVQLVSLNKIVTWTGDVLVKLTSLNDYPLWDAPDSPTWQFLCHR